ncbi:hypothetical protein ABD76_03295 [Paenibacillus dendritiformis]|nr:hypothetical protein [Paenibacillus dendritiformis]
MSSKLRRDNSFIEKSEDQSNFVDRYLHSIKKRNEIKALQTDKTNKINCPQALKQNFSSAFMPDCIFYPFKQVFQVNQFLSEKKFPMI